jgi:phosphoglycerol transferase MdoB-like AlkP superfamily enzyme
MTASTNDHDGVLLRSRFVLVAVLAATFLVAGLLTRLALVALQASKYGFPVERLPAVLGVGLVYDLLATLWLCAPVMFLVAVLPAPAFQGRTARATWGGLLMVVTYLAVFFAAVEVAFFAEFNGRFNSIVVDAVAYPQELGSDIWTTYPTGRVILAVAAVVGTILWASRDLWGGCERIPTAPRHRFAALVPYVGLLAVLSAEVNPGLMRVSDDRAVNQVASSGYYTLWQALQARNAQFEHVYPTLPDSVMYPRLGQLLRETEEDSTSLVPGSVARRIEAAGPERRLNVVVILEESFGSGFVGSLHPEGPRATPEFDSLIAGGTLLTHAYSTGSRTVRAIEAVCASVPPLPGLPVIRRPESIGMETLPSVLRANGYATGFVYAGHASFDGMEGFLKANGVERIVDQRDMPAKSFSTAWGVADEVLLDRALAEMDGMAQGGRPFFSLVLTVSNHPPYTYPAGRIAADPKRQLQENAVRYADWALGRFIRQARQRPWFERTLFVVLGDHGPHVFGPAEIPMSGYEVPILFYSPAVLPAGRVETVASSMDVAPTVLGLLNIGYESHFFGQDALRAPVQRGRALMAQNTELALLRGDRIAVLGPRRTVAVYSLDRATGGQHRRDGLDPADRRLVEDAVSYFAGADRMYRAGRLAGGALAGAPGQVPR